MKLNTQYVSNNNTKTGTMTPKYIVIHNTDNFKKGANALAHAKAQYNGNFADMSCHWYVDDGDTAYQAAPHNKGDGMSVRTTAVNFSVLYQTTIQLVLKCAYNQGMIMKRRSRIPWNCVNGS